MNNDLARLADEYWNGRMRADPVEATVFGYRDFDDRMPDISPEAQEADVRRLEGIQRRVEAVTVAGRVPGDPDRITHAALLNEIENDLAVRACGIQDWAVDPRDGPQVGLLSLAHLQTIDTPERGAALATRWRAMPGYLDQKIANLRRAAVSGRLATRGSVESVLLQLRAITAANAADSDLAAPVRADLPGWPSEKAAAFRENLTKIVEREIVPAFARFENFLRAEILPRARGDEALGLLHIPGGSAAYDRLIKVHTSLPLRPEEIHQIGLDEIEKIRTEMFALGRKLFGPLDLAAIQARLRSDRDLYFSDRDAVERKAVDALARANAITPRWIGRCPGTPCVVKRIESFEEKDTTIAYYRQPAIDGSRPGTYYINTFAPETRPRYEAEALAFHESVPGHHTQIALAQEMPSVPEFRKHLGVTAYVEGWALYTERLADEMGLYSGDLDRMGMLSFDAWRASRLVVDTGLHVKGWSRQRAIDYMFNNTALALNNITNEVDRYAGWPGQALAYKIGQREIFALRREAEQRLGSRFNIRAFHDAVLQNGAVSLPVLREFVVGVVGIEPTASTV